MEYKRQVPFGGAIAAEAAKAKNQTVEMRDMGFATVTIAEKDGSGQQRTNNVGQARLAPSLWDAGQTCLIVFMSDTHSSEGCW